MNKTALVTGASSGLGLEFARLLAADGYDLILVARSEGKLYGIKNEIEKKHGVSVHVCPVDLSVPDAAWDVFDFTLERGLQVDVLINNAGLGTFGRFINQDWKKQYEIAQVNMIALMQMTHCFMKQMVERGTGKIVNVASVASVSPGPNMSIYYASKAFVRSFSESMSEEAKGSGVSVMAFCPGPTATGFERAANAKDTAMFKGAANARDTAKAGYDAMKKGRVVYYYNWYAKALHVFSKLMPESIARKYAAYKNRTKGAVCQVAGPADGDLKWLQKN